MDVVIRGRATASRRCAWCHDAAGRLGAPCAGCGTWLHGACWSEAAQACPTRGCVASKSLPRPLSTPPDWSNAAAAIFLALFLSLPLLGGLVRLLDHPLKYSPHDGRESRINADITAKINAGQ